MAPVEQYLMDRDAEIALARSAAPDAISHDASVLILAGHSKQDVIAALKAGINNKEFAPLEQGTVCYMMSKSSYLTDQGGHNGSHLMFYQTDTDAAAYPQLNAFPPLSVFLVRVDNWSDGTPART